MSDAIASETRSRALRSSGTSENAVYAMIDRALQQRGVKSETVVDLGCGVGALHSTLARYCKNYIGVDAVRYENFPADASFIEADLNAPRFPIDSQSADLVVAAETIEHLENPRALLREITRVVKPRGWIVVTTPNQLSFLSLGTLALKRRFSAFQDVHYPAHITALLEHDLIRIATECGLREPAVQYSEHGRIVLTPLHYPSVVSKLFPRLCSDNVLLIARAP